MDVTIQHDKVDDMIYTTTIHPLNKNPITVDTLWNGSDWSGSDSLLVNNWVSKIKKIQYKKRDKNLILSLVADRSAQYKNNDFSYYDYKGKISKAPFELLQLCVDNHYLFYDLYDCRYDYKKKPLSLWRLLSDNKTIVVGVGIEGVVKKLEKDYDMKISKWVDLRDKAREKGVFGEIASNCSVEKLAKKVLGEEWDVNKPSSMEWWNSEHDWLLSDEKVKFGSLESFLAYRIALELLL